MFWSFLLVLLKNVENRKNTVNNNKNKIQEQEQTITTKLINNIPNNNNIPTITINNNDNPVETTTRKMSRKNNKLRFVKVRGSEEVVWEKLRPKSYQNSQKKKILVPYLYSYQ